MKDLLRKLNFKGYKRIAIINAGTDFLKSLSDELSEVTIDTEIDQRCPYNFMMLCVKSIEEVDEISPLALHNLTADGILGFAIQKEFKKLNIRPERDKAGNH